MMSDNPQFQEAAAIFGILHNIWFATPDQAFLNSLNQGVIESWPAHNDIESNALNTLKQSLKSESLKTIKADHFRLFVGAHKKLAYPWGSVYTDPEGLMYGDTTQAFEAFCHDHRIEFKLPYRQPLDHIGIIMATLSRLFAQEGTSQVEDAVKELLGDHLLPWVERFMMSVELNANTEFYRGFSILMREQITYWEHRFQVKAKEIKLFR
ncbi:TorD/DmsD family molecular chaperone [Ferrimonas kyonanensis]|uniref:TorD/DmsD family molecular chaperone n=1 Tax=Ferrimonas kyonanensis TaxID=364763 RepID=UPI00040A0C15|nr:molecular chaperone TorD family protein [Ferrimonas kyonanensis]